MKAFIVRRGPQFLVVAGERTLMTFHDDGAARRLAAVVGGEVRWADVKAAVKEGGLAGYSQNFHDPISGLPMSPADLARICVWVAGGEEISAAAGGVKPHSIPGAPALPAVSASTASAVRRGEDLGEADRLRFATFVAETAAALAKDAEGQRRIAASFGVAADATTAELAGAIMAQMPQKLAAGPATAAEAAYGLVLAGLTMDRKGMMLALREAAGIFAMIACAVAHAATHPHPERT